MLRKLAIGFAILILLSMISRIGNDRSDNENTNSVQDQYSSTWKSEINIDITKSLVKNNVTGCGEFHYKQSKSQPSEYYVKCTSDGYNWTYYLVWTQTKKVLRVKEIE